MFRHSHRVPEMFGMIRCENGSNGWFMSWKIPSINGWRLGLALWLRKPPFMNQAEIRRFLTMLHSCLSHGHAFWVRQMAIKMACTHSHSHFSHGEFQSHGGNPKSSKLWMTRWPSNSIGQQHSTMVTWGSQVWEPHVSLRKSRTGNVFRHLRWFHPANDYGGIPTGFLDPKEHFIGKVL